MNNLHKIFTKIIKTRVFLKTLLLTAGDSFYKIFRKIYLTHKNIYF